MISRLTLLLKGKVVFAIVGTLLVAGGGTTIAVAATGAKVSIPLVSQASPLVHQSDSTSSTATASEVEGQDENANDNNQNQNGDQDEHELNGTIMSIDATSSSFVLKLSGGTTKTIEVSAKTEFDGDGDFQRFSDLKVGLSVEVEGNLQSNGTIAATKVHREDNDSTGDDGSGGSNGGDNGSGDGGGISGGNSGGGISGGNRSSTPSPNGSDH